MYKYVVLKNLWRDSKGATAVEYGLIVSLIVLAVITGIRTLGTETANKWDDVATEMAAAREP